MTVSNLRIRMYRQGFGDCFLLTFSDEADRPFHLMIDFGVYSGQEMMDDIAADIVRETNGKIDTLVVTHEHWDHVSGFRQTDILQHLTIDRLWMAWTENPQDNHAINLQRDKLSFVGTLTKAWFRLAAGPPDTRPTARHNMLAGLLAFEGVSLSTDPAALGATEKVNKTKAAFDAVKAAVPANRTSYLNPGQVLSLRTATNEPLDDIRVYVLGPPRDRSQLKLMNRQRDLYPDADEPARFSLFSWAARPNDDTTTGDADEVAPTHDTPFGNSPLVIRADDPRFAELQKQHFGKPDATTRSRKPDNTWRDIGLDWLGASEALALQLNTYTNNTSLVLAIELTRQGKVLLFPGDAQLGNWLSWQAVQFGELDREAVPAARVRSGQPVVTTDDLLARTVFYKVGHHGSHNATPKAAGLEKMTNPDLVAMMPVSHQMIASRRWPIPFVSLRNRLLEKTRHQCVRADFSDEGVNEPLPPVFTASDLHIDYNIKP